MSGSGRVFKTGDLALRLPGDEIKHLGRSDNQLKIRGVRVELGEVEAVVAASPLIDRAAVVAAQGRLGALQLVAFVCYKETLAPDSLDLSGELRAYIRTKLPEPMVPARIVSVEELPFNANGKVDRLALTAQASSQGEPRSTPPRTPTERQLTALWQSVLGVSPIGVNDDFFALGGQSLLAMRLLVNLRHALGVDLPLSALFEGPTIAALAARLDADQPLPSPEDGATVTALQAEVSLDPAIRWDGCAPPADQSRATFLTGATGFLGASLLAELLEQGAATVYCLVRGEATAQGALSRLKRARDRFGLKWHGASAQVRPILGDLSAPRLGLSEDKFAELGDSAGTIIHAGAQVNEVYPYAALRAANVGGTHEALRLASIGRRSDFHFVSTTAVFESLGYLDAPVIGDDAPLDAARVVYGGYAQSKWVAEKMVMAARQRGLHTTIYRPGAISGDSRTGVTDPSQTLGRLLLGIVAQGAAPELEAALTMTPVNYVSHAIVQLTKLPSSRNRQFNLVSPHPLTMTQLAALMRASGREIASQPYPAWVDDVTAAVVSDPEHPLADILPLLTTPIPGTTRPALEWSTVTSRVQSEGAARAMSRVGVECPRVDATLLDLYLSWLTTASNSLQGNRR